MRLDYSGVTQSYVSGKRDLEWASSLRVMLIMRTRKMQLDKTSVPEWILNNKIKAYKFIDLLGFRRPQVLHSNIRAESISPSGRVVIKPYNGYSSRGVYLALKEDHIYKIKSKETIGNWDDLHREMKNDLASGMVREDRWIVEELVLEDDNDHQPARDLKFYCFYGHVALVLEIVRYPETVYCFWDQHKNRIDTGAYLDCSFSGNGFTDHMLETAKSISLEIPSPFVRIDFHSAGSHLVFCEFTPRPGGAWLYNREIDQTMGDAYLAAEGRLIKDFLKGKKFEAFLQL